MQLAGDSDLYLAPLEIPAGIFLISFFRNPKFSTPGIARMFPYPPNGGAIFI